jgi:hypothetical protein
MLQIHVALSLIGMVSGFVVLYGLLTGRSLDAWAAIFLVTTILTSVTGFPLEPSGFDPARAIGVISLVLLAAAVVALYAFHLAGRWRPVYIIAAATALYLNAFVGVVQAFQKLPFLRPLAPTQSEPPFVVTQLVVLLAFIALGALALARFHPKARGTA